jgi:hypothetical protein
MLAYIQSLSKIGSICSAIFCLFLMSTQSFELSSPYISNVYPYLIIASILSIVLAFYPNTIIGIPAFIYNFLIGSTIFTLTYKGLYLYYFSTVDALNAKWLVIKYVWTPERLQRAFVNKIQRIQPDFDFNKLDSRYLQKVLNCKSNVELDRIVNEIINQTSYNFEFYGKIVLVVLGVTFIAVAGFYVLNTILGQDNVNQKIDEVAKSHLEAIKKIESDHASLAQTVSDLRQGSLNLTTVVTNLATRVDEAFPRIETAMNAAGQLGKSMNNMLLLNPALSVLAQAFGLEGLHTTAEIELAKRSLQDYFDKTLLWANELANRAKALNGMEHVLPATYKPEAYAQAVKDSLRQAVTQPGFINNIKELDK